MHFTVMFVTAVCVLLLIKLRWPKKKNFCKDDDDDDDDDDDNDDDDDDDERFTGITKNGVTLLTR